MAESGKHFEKATGYIASQSARAKKKPRRREVLEPVITISRQTGAGAVTLAGGLAEYLNKRTGVKERAWEVFDKTLMRQVLDDHDLPAHLERFMPEDGPKQVKDALGDMLGLHPPNWELVRHTGETIYGLARKGKCILVGRGANIITRDLPNALHLRLIGSLERRVIRCQDYYGIEEAEAVELIRKQDRARRRYLLAYYDIEIDDPTNYHLVINVDRYEPQALVRLVGDVVSKWSVGFDI
jgi:cytidylate kinase